MFRSWAGFLSPGVEVAAANLSGRGARFSEPPITSLPILIEQLGTEIVQQNAKPFALFGHSMGALIAFELARWLFRTGGCPPHRVVLSGCGAPHLLHRREATVVLHQLDDHALVARLEQLHAIPADIKADPELMPAVVNMLRADLQLVETYVYVPSAPLPCPLTVFGGRADPLVSRSELLAWMEHTRAEFHLELFDGDHFFLVSDRERLLAAVAQLLEHAQ